MTWDSLKFVFKNDDFDLTSAGMEFKRGEFYIDRPIGRNYRSIYNKYKSSISKYLGSRTYKMSPLLKNMIKSYVRKNKISDGDYLFKRPQGGPIGEAMATYLSDLTVKIFGLIY